MVVHSPPPGMAHTHDHPARQAPGPHQEHRTEPGTDISTESSNASDINVVTDVENTWPARWPTPTPSPVYWFIVQDYLEAPSGCLPADPSSGLLPYVSPAASPIIETSATPSGLNLTTSLNLALRSTCPSDFPAEKGKVEEKLEYIDHMLRVEQTKETYSSLGGRAFWEPRRLKTKERAESGEDGRNGHKMESW